MPNIIRRDDAECLDDDPPPEVDPMNGSSHSRYDGHTTDAIPLGHTAAASQGDLKGKRSSGTVVRYCHERDNRC